MTFSNLDAALLYASTRGAATNPPSRSPSRHASAATTVGCEVTRKLDEIDERIESLMLRLDDLGTPSPSPADRHLDTPGCGYIHKAPSEALRRP